MRRHTVLFLTLAVCAGCGEGNPPGVITLPSRPRGEIRTPDAVHILEAAFADDGTQVLLAGYAEWDANRPRYPGERRDAASFVSLADVTSGKEIWKVTQREAYRRPAFVPGRLWVVVWNRQGFEIWDRKTGAPIKGSHALFATWPDQGYFVPAAEGKRLVGWGCKAQAPRDHPYVLDLRVWELPGLRERARFGPEPFGGLQLDQVIPAPQGSLALLTTAPSGSHDQRQLRIWDTESGQVLHEFGVLHESGARVEGWNPKAAAWSPDGRRVLLERYEIEGNELHRSYLVLWDAVQGKLVRSLADRPPLHGVLGPPALFLAFSADGAQAVSVDWDRTFRRWDVATGQELTSAKFDEPGLMPGILALSRDGALAVSDRRNIWGTATGKVLRTLEETPWERPLWDN